MEPNMAVLESACSKPLRKSRWPVGEDQPKPSTSIESDLCCMEDSWDKESPDPAAAPAPVRPISMAASALRAALPARVTASERAALRRPRPGGSYGTKCLSFGDPFEERVDSLVKLLHAQDKFRPARHRGGERPLFFSVSPFVAERRRWFVAWKSRMATFFGYSRDTVAVALNYFDRYTSLKECNPTLAQAVAVTSLHIAAKFEEPRPAPLRQLIKFTPVFTPKQLLLMELSVLKVLDWELRPVTVYDCVRGFCSVLPITSRSEGTSSALPSKERKQEEVEQLRVWAEEIADLSAYDVGFVEFLPSTMAVSALLLSVSRGTRVSAPNPISSPVPLPRVATSAIAVAITSHEEVLDACCKTVTGIPSLQRVLDCVQLLGSSLAESYPAVAAAAGVAAAEVAQYSDRHDATESGVQAILSRAATTSSSAGPATGSSREAMPPASTASALAALPVKGQRCCTPTGVEGIMHIEMAASGDGRSGASGVQTEPANLGVSVVPLGEREESVAKHPRPTPCSTRNRSRNRAESFAFSDEDVAFARAAKKSKSAVDVAAPSAEHRQPSAEKESSVASRVAGRRPARIRQQQQQHPKQKSQCVTSRCSLKPFASQSSAFPGGGSGNEQTRCSSTLLRCRIRSAEALGHCKNGSGFGAPAPRAIKTESCSFDAGEVAAASKR